MKGTATVSIRAAQPDDAEAIALIWSEGWADAHLGNVPPELVALRSPSSFRRRAEQRIGSTIVAADGGGIAGFVTVVDDEVEQLYVAAPFRGHRVADRLLTCAEQRIAAAGHPRAWLAVVAGNLRARWFYERMGWIDDGPIEYQAQAEDGPIAVPAHRFVKVLA